jgi:hypothetical protein
VVLGLALAAITLVAGRLAFSFDAWWHVRSGDLILDRGAIPREDPFAWTAAGSPWRLNSWLYDVLMAALRRAGGTGAMVAVTLVAVALFGIACYSLARSAGAGRWPSVAVASALTFLLTPLASERPQQVSYLLFAAVLVLTPLALDGSNRALVGLVGLFAFWVNLHFAFTAGVILVLLLASAAVVEKRRLRRPALVVGAVVTAGLLNPFGWRAYGAAFETRGTSRTIEEWQRLNPTTLRDLVYLLTILLALAALWRTGRWRRLGSLLPVVAFSFLAIDAVRNVPFMLLVVAAELALGCSSLRLTRLRQRVGPLFVHGLAVALAALVLLSLPVLADARPVETRVYPVHTTDAIPDGCRLLNQYEFGGYITDQRWPEVLVSQDGRNGSEQDFERQREVIEAQAGALRWIDDSGVACVLVAPDRPIVGLLRERGWRETASDPSAVLLLRP